MNGRLLKEIEDKRMIMMQAVINNGINSREAIQKSQELDVLINQHLHYLQLKDKTICHS